MKKLTLVLTLLLISIALIGCAKKRNQAPVIQGVQREVSIEVGESYDPLDGVVVTDDNDSNIKPVVVGDYDVHSVGVYDFSIKATDSAGLSDEKPVTLTVNDSTSENLLPQLIGIVADQTYYIGTGDYNPIANVSATDAEDGIITSSIQVVYPTNFDLTVAGTYTIIIKVKDSANATAQKTIVLNVVQSLVPDELTTEPIEVTFWHAFGQDKEALIQGYADKFKEMYPNVTITLTTQGSYEDLRSKVASAIVAGTEPTMLIGYPDHLSSYLSADAVEKLDPYVQHPTHGVDLADFVQSYITENKSYDTQGTLYGLPFNKSTEVFVYNKTYFQANNLTVPTTWAEVEAVSRQIKAKNTAADVYGFAYDSAANMFITLTRQWGGQYTGIDSTGKGTILFDNAQTREMLAYFEGLSNEKLMTLPQTWEQNYASEPFKSGKVFMTVGSTAGISYNVPANGAFEIGVAPIPQKDAEHKAVIQQGTNISIMKSASAQEKLAAWLFTKYLTSTDITTDWAMKTGYLPVRNSAFTSTLYQQFLNTPEPDKKYISMAANAAYAQKDYMFVDQPFIGSSKVRVQVDLLLNTVIVGNVSIDEAISKAKSEIE